MKRPAKRLTSNPITSDRCARSMITIHAGGTWTPERFFTTKKAPVMTRPERIVTRMPSRRVQPRLFLPETKNTVR